MNAHLHISQRAVFELAGVTRGEYRQWERLFSSAVDRGVKRPTFTAAQTLAICVLAELMHAMDAGAHHLDEMAADFFNEVCTDDWRRFEHRLLVLAIIIDRCAPTGHVAHSTFTTVPRTKPLQPISGAIMITLDLAPFVQRVSRFITGVDSEPRPEQMTLLGAPGNQPGVTELPPREAPTSGG